MNDYERITIIGKGPLGLTYKMRAKDSSKKAGGDDIVACKVVGKIDEPSGQIRTILEETIVFGPTPYPNIAVCFDLYHDRKADTFYFIQEYFPYTLHDLLLKRQHAGAYIPEEVFWEIMAQIVQAMLFLHSSAGKTVKNCNYESLVVHQLVHSNLKPSNIGITADGRIKLMDNRIRQPVRAYLEKCSDMSLHYYTAPELYDSEDKWTAAIDLWSMGCIAFHIIFLRPPFQAAMLDQILAQQRSGVYPPIPAQYSQDVREFIFALLTLDHTRRPSVETISSNARISAARTRLSGSTKTCLSTILN